MKIRIFPALADNYMYLIIDEKSKEAAVIDPVEPDSVLKAVRDEGINLTTVLITHHHWDHTDGNESIIKNYKNNLEIYGGDNRIPLLTKFIKHGDKVKVGNLEFECIFTPCHTSGHICYYVKPEDEYPVVFTGDTLFIAGCGRFVEGTAEQMYDALVNKLGSLPDNTKVYCAHEYTLQNLNFAHHVEPHNQKILTKIEWVTQQRAKGNPTVPSTIGEEKEINPFMRVIQKTVQDHAKTEDPISTMAAIREEKNLFKGNN